MKVQITGELTMPALRQALFEQICSLEEEHLIRHCKGVSMYLTPTNGFGEPVVPRKECGAVLDAVSAAPYSCAADAYSL